jgi:hypothetical protein
MPRHDPRFDPVCERTFRRFPRAARISPAGTSDCDRMASSCAPVFRGTSVFATAPPAAASSATGGSIATLATAPIAAYPGKKPL